MAKEQVFMALFLFGMGGWAIYGGFRAPHVHPKYRRGAGEPKTFSHRLADVSPGAERFLSKAAAVVGGVAMIAGGVYVLVHEW